MAFDRFVKRYAAALEDSSFLDELGPIPAVTNAAVFNHLLVRLLERNAASPRWAVYAQLRTWAFLWGDSQSQGVASPVDEEVAGLVRQVLDQSRARLTTLRGLAMAVEYAADDSLAAIRDASQLIISSPRFGLDPNLLIEAAGRVEPAHDLLDVFARSAANHTEGELLDMVVTPLGLTRTSASWRHERVARRGRTTYKSRTLVVTAQVDGLTTQLAEDALSRAAMAAHYAGQESDYVRIRFEGNGKSVAFWDQAAARGVVMIEDQVHPLARIAPPLPKWELRIGELRAGLARGASASA